ncbi:hypothetical protein V502_01231 [Pseudogymnoascus sp. VKM F-4520 (FW-2644)]|nr:hypothetical protein V502_01231 [Pseudogymnoascus sp. VKM F-4520 (FW-2644)]
MTDSKMDEVKDGRKLKGKTNFVGWKREFERAAKANDILEYLTGEEVVPPKPQKEDYFVKSIEAETRRPFRAKKTAQTFTPSTDDDDETADVQAMMSTNNSLRWHIDSDEHKTAKAKMKLAGKLLDAWVSDGIKIEVEDCADAKEAYDFIKKRYAVTMERARDGLLNQLNELKLDDCLSMTEYTNGVRQIKADLKTVKYDMTDDMLATALLHGLPPNFRDFKEKYDWIRSTKPDDPPDLDYLYERLHVEEAKQIRMKEERKVKEKVRKETGGNNSSGGTAYNGRLKPNREDRSHLKCTYPGCGKTGHTEESCWTKDPSKVPRSLKDRFAVNIDSKPINGMGGTTETNLATFKDAYSRPGSLGTAPSPALHANIADTSPQMRSVGACRKLQGSGGVGTGDLGTRESSLSERTLGAFLVGTSCTPDTWLADTGANMHIVNDIKWFKEETFRSFNDCSIDISTADSSATLEVKGGGVVQVVLKTPDGFPVTVSLSEVAYAPQGKCNLFSGGMFAKKAKLTGVYNDQYMTWINDQGHKIGHATFENGLYHLNAENALSPFESGEVVAATVNFDDPVWRWHRRLGHLGFQNMLNLLDSSTGMEVTAAQIRAKLKAVCPVCAVTRALVKIPRDPAKRRTQEPGQMVHVDVWGPYPIEGFDGTKYFLFITDDCTRYTWSARFDRKSQLLEVFKSLVKIIQKAYNITIRCCRLDNEFERGPVGRWCDAHSIVREPIEPYAHYQNGVAERTNRTIREKTAPMVQETTISGQVSKIISEKGTELLRASSIPENLWPEAIQHAIWLKNRTPARALRKKDKRTPYEALKGDKPTLSRERIWGSRAYVTYPPEFRLRAEMTKLHSPRGWLGYFVGCESEAMYHIYSPEKHKVYRIGTARVEDGEGLDDPHDAPCLEDRVSTTDVVISDQIDLETDDEMASDQNDGNRVVALAPEEAELYTESERSDAEDDAQQHQSSHTDPDIESESDDDTAGPAGVSKYFIRPRHAGMAKLKTGDNTVLAPEQNRQATHDVDNVDKGQSSSEDSDIADESWYYSDDGSVSQAYWNFVAKHGARTMKNYLPDDEKCDKCFRFGRKCDLTMKGTPCTMCAERGGGVCRPQTKQTKKLVLPKNRSWKKQITGLEQDPPCRKCFIFSVPCLLGDPADSQCKRCQKLNRPCVWDLKGAEKSTYNEDRKAERKQASQERLGFSAVSRDLKCYRCAKKRIACDGKQPCNKCNSKRLHTTCRPQGLEQLPICVHCSSVNAHCDRGRPCKRCLNKKRTCSYEAQGGLLFRSYTVPNGPVPRGFTSVGALVEGESSDEECVRCRRRKLTCSGEQPCNRCVRDQTTFQIAQCNYRHSDGTYESWTVRPFQLDETGQPRIREKYESYTGRKRNASEEVKALINTSRTRRLVEGKDWRPQVDETDTDDIDESTANGLHEAAKGKLKRFKFGLSAYREQSVPPFELRLNGSHDVKYHEAKKEELKSHEEKGTWRVVTLPKGVKPVTSRWVNTDKYGPDGQLIKHKSRLVARGFQQEEGIDYEETFASVVKPASTRILLALAAILSWPIHQGDVKTAFLNSNLDKPVYMRPPKDIKLPHGFCLMVIRALYGLKQSPRAWYQKLRTTLISWGWRMSAYDPCVFINDSTGLILEVHVDDINVMGRDLQTILEFKTQISQTFQMTDEGECSWYLGMHVEQKTGEIRIHQKKYIDEIVAKYGFSDAAPVKTPLDKDIKLSTQDDYTAHPKFRKEYQSKVGSLNFASNQTRPDIAFATGYVARYASNPNQEHMKAVDRIFAYLKKDPGKGIVYSGKHGLQLTGFVDSDFAGCEDSRKSTTGWVFTLAGGPVSWSSQRQKTVATSTMDAEYIAGAEAAKEAVWIRNFINDLRIPQVHIDTVPLYIDNNSALKLTRNPEFHSRSKHIDVKHHFIREKVEEGVINTQRVDTTDNLADVFTKALAKPMHEDLVQRLNLLSGGD